MSYPLIPISVVSSLTPLLKPFLLAGLALLLEVFVGTPATASPTDATQLEKGVFLVASGQLTGSIFSRSVIFITEYNSQGATGLIITRPTNIPLSRVIPRIENIEGKTANLFIGGPVVPGAVFSLIRTARSHATQNHVVENVSFSAGADSLIHMVNNAGPGDTIRAYTGYSGWAPGQLEGEVARGDWLVVHSGLAIILDDDPHQIWRNLMKKWSGQWI